MALVRFAIGTTATLSEVDAGVLAELLAVGDNPMATNLAGRIARRAALDDDRAEAGDDITLSHDELSELAGLFEDIRDLLETPAFARLDLELRYELDAD